MSARSIKIEEVDGGLGREHRRKSYIRLRGKWLTDAGFRPGARVVVQVTTSGQIVLTSEDLLTKDQPVEI